MSDQRALKYKKRSRVRGIRNALITFFVIWIIASIGIVTFLTIKVFSLQSQIDKLTEPHGSVSLIEDLVEETQTPSAGEYDYAASPTDGTAESNLAGLSDTYKVYLTFDDGPSGNTDKILDILDDYGIKATFFVQGKDPDVYGDRYRRIVEEGHTIGMHTLTHVYSQVYESLDSFKADVTGISDRIFETTGVRTHYYRFPGGSKNGIAGSRIGDYIEYLSENGIVYFDWNVASNDAGTPHLSKEAIVENVTRDVLKYKTSIVLMHDADDLGSTVEALPILIDKLQEMGAILLPISDDTRVIQQITISD